MCVGFKAQAKFAPNFYWVYSLLYKIILYSVSICFFFDILSGGVEFAWGRKVPETNINWRPDTYLTRLPKFSCLDFYVVDILFIVFLRYSVLEKSYCSLFLILESIQCPGRLNIFFNCLLFCFLLNVTEVTAEKWIHLPQKLQDSKKISEAGCLSVN